MNDTTEQTAHSRSAGTDFANASSSIAGSADESRAREQHARQVREMFARIAGRYDLLNHLLSVNVDKLWRRRVRRLLAPVLARPDARLLDVACGTGDLALELRAHGAARVTGLDFCRPMLEIADRKSRDDANNTRAALPYVEADALRLPFADAAFDGVTIAFGLRNLASVEEGLAELRRVLAPAGRGVILEFSQPVVPGFGALFNFYFNQVLPRIGGAVSGSQSAYEYLPASVRRFPDQRRLAEMMRRAGFSDVTYTNLTGGIAAIHTGVKQ